MEWSREEVSLADFLTLEKVRKLQSALMNWFLVHGRHEIPWKLKKDGTPPQPDEAISPYGIWIAEVMLQQTRLDVALPYWDKWMKKFPTLIDLANASEQEVLLIWQGLGYYSRARRILATAKKLSEIIGANDSRDPLVWPKDIEIWMSFPGIGRTTAGSILSSAFDLPAALLDGNVKRVLARLTANLKPEEDSEDELWALSEQLLDRQTPRNFNQALMDLGALVCKPRNPTCLKCPWRGHCIVYCANQVADFPVKRASKNFSFQVIGIGIVFNKAGEVLIDQRLNDGFLGGMWEFPGGKKEPNENIKETIARELKEELAIEVEVGEQLISLEHTYSNKKLSFIVHLCTWISGEPQSLESQQFRWVKPIQLSDYPFPSANAKMITALQRFLQKDNSSESL